MQRCCNYIILIIRKLTLNPSLELTVAVYLGVKKLLAPLQKEKDSLIFNNYMIDNKKMKIPNTFLKKYRGTGIGTKKVSRYFCIRYCPPLFAISKDFPIAASLAHLNLFLS